MSECLFCGIVAGTTPAHVIWEDNQHLAFLSIFPNTPGTSVVIPKSTTRATSPRCRPASLNGSTALPPMSPSY